MQIFINFVGRSHTILNVEFSTTIKEIEEMLIERFNLESSDIVYTEKKDLSDLFKINQNASIKEVEEFLNANNE